MNKRIYTLLNFIAFNLLFFALYLNFIRKDNQPAAAAVQHHVHTNTVVAQTEQKGAENNFEHTAAKHSDTYNNGTALKLSFN